MRWTRGASRRNVDDRRGTPGRRAVGGGLGLGGLVLILLFAWISGADLTQILGIVADNAASGGGSAAPTQPPNQPIDPANDVAGDFATFTFNDVQDTWAAILPGYREARLVLFTDGTESGCGYAQSATGPFYCPGDQQVYIDLSFNDELSQRFGAPGDFAQAYVLAHELGHHVQYLLGTEREVRAAQQRNPGAQNELSVRMELQADCYAGVWGARAAQDGLLETGDVEEGLNAAAAIGDDRLQRAGRRTRRAGQLHPRLLCPACRVVPSRFAVRRSEQLRHLLGNLIRLGLAYSTLLTRRTALPACRDTRSCCSASNPPEPEF